MTVEKTCYIVKDCDNYTVFDSLTEALDWLRNEVLPTYLEPTDLLEEIMTWAVDDFHYLGKVSFFRGAIEVLPAQRRWNHYKI